MTDKDLFLKNYSFYGKHAEMVSQLTSSISNDFNLSVFNTAIDLFVFAALVGVKNNHREKPSVDKSKRMNILVEQFNSHIIKVRMVFKLVTLLGNQIDFDEKDRLNRTFRNPNQDEIYVQFEEYMLGGLEDIYNHIMVSSNRTFMDYLNSVHVFLDAFRPKEEMKTNSIIPGAEDLFD